ncbi:MAG: beta-galactosidase, partial [Chloroflexota bacterium]
MRNSIVFIVALFVTLGGTVAAIATTQYRNEQLRGYVNPVQDANLPFQVPRLGVNTSLEQYTDDELTAQLNLMTESSIVWVRQIFPWAEMEPVAGGYDWERWDRIVEAVDAHPDLELVAVLYTSPEWAVAPQADTPLTAPPDDPADFAQFARVFANRYGDSIDAYQIWDEPNLDDAWGGFNPSPVDYTAVL